MGKKAKCFLAVRNAFHSPTKNSEKSPVKSTSKAETTEEGKTKKLKEKRRWSLGKSPNQERAEKCTNDSKLVSRPEQPCTESDLQNNHASIMPLATETAADAAIPAVESGGEVVQPAEVKKVLCYGDKSREEWAAITIQTAFRGYLARRALRALKGLARLRALVCGHAGKQQATIALRYTQALVKIQAHVRARRARSSEEGQAIQRQIWEKRQQEIHERKSMSDENVNEGWNDSTQSAEEVQARIQARQEAALKRERALAYAFSHQLWRSAPNEASVYLDCESDKPHWGWSWLDRWMAGRPWETRFYDKEDRDKSTKVEMDSLRLMKGAISREGSLQEGANRVLNSYCSALHNKVKNVGPLSPKSTHVSRPAPVQVHSASPRTFQIAEDGNVETRSTPSIRSAAIRFGSRSSYASSIWDEESLAGLPSCPNYMSATQSARAKSRKQSSGTLENELLASVKKRWSYPITASPRDYGSHVQPGKTTMFQHNQNNSGLKSVPEVIKMHRSTASLESTGQNI